MAGANGLDGWFRFGSREDYLQSLEAEADVFAARWIWGQHLVASCAHQGRYAGYCGVCQRPADFSFSADAGEAVNLREELVCSHCGLSARIRVVLQMLMESHPIGDAARIYLTEQASLLYKFVYERWPNVVGSEYFGDDAQARLIWYLRHLVGEHALLRHEDVTALSFADNALDVIISCDVLEHVPDYRAALTEFSRVLVPGGRLILTVPFMDGHAQTTIRARMLDDGSIEHLEEPEYHGDPVDSKGVLAFYNFAWDLLDVVRAAGFAEAAWRLPWAPAEGLFTTLWTLEARK